MNKRQKKKMWTKIKKQEKSWAKDGIYILGGGITLGYGWVYNKKGDPTKLI